MNKVVLLFLIFVQVSVISAENDSLWSVFRNTKLHDSVRLEAFNDIAWEYLYTNPDSAYLLGHEELEKARAVHLPNWESKALNTIGASYQVRGNFLKAIECYQQSMTIREKIGDKMGKSSALANIGSIYINLGEFHKALYYEEKSLKLFEEVKNRQGQASTLNNLGVIYRNLGEYQKALGYNEQSLRLYNDIGDKQGLAAANDNIGNIYVNLGKYSEALQYLRESLKIDEEIGDQSATATIYSSIARALYKQKKYPEALTYAEKGRKLSSELEDIASQREARNVLYEIYRETGNKAKALENYEEFISLRDTLMKEENQREINNKELQYEFDKKHAADSVRHEEEKRVSAALMNVKNAEIEQDKTQKWALSGGLLLLLISGGVMYNRFRITRRQKEIIETKNQETELQKAIIEAKQKEILASIAYAKRLQEAILPPARIIRELLPGAFIFYRPKDIVAGDFYWMEKYGEWTFFAAADCTGHGVPGAMVSVVCSNALNRAVKEFHIIDPGLILDKVRELVTETFEKSESEVNDGMDISLCAWKKSDSTLFWAGANNPLWLVRNKEVEEYKPTKQAIGKTDNPVPYQSHVVKLMKGDLLYLFTDGFADQFGGEKGKKFNYKKLQSLLLSNCHLPLESQEEKLAAALQSWRGNLEQVDDILVMGIRIS